MRSVQIAGGTLLAAALLAVPAVAAPPPPDARGWLGEELPLPLAVRTPQDLAVKSAAEKQYLIFNLLAGGKLAWDAGDFATAATKWEALLQDPPARSRAGEDHPAAGARGAQPRRRSARRRGAGRRAASVGAAARRLRAAARTARVRATTRRSP